MYEVIAKKYVRAILLSLTKDEVEKLVVQFRILTDACKVKKFIAILNSPTVESKDKVKFVLSLVDAKMEKLSNIINILAEKDRLLIIPVIFRELELSLSRKNNSFLGKIYSKSELSSHLISDLENSLSKKLDSKITLKSVVSEYPGIKVEIDGLGVDISYSQSRLKYQLTEHILRAL